MNLKPLLLAAALAFFAAGTVFAQTSSDELNNNPFGDFFQNPLNIYEQTEDADYYNRQGIEFYNKGDYPKAIESFLKAKDLYEKTLGKDHPSYATSLNNLGEL